MSIRASINQTLHRLGLHVTKQADPGRIPWLLKGLDTAPSPLKWLAPEIIRRHGLKTLVQVGANDGDVGDPISACIREFNLQGILVEPQPGPCAVLRKKYEGVDHIAIDQAAISSEAGHITLYYFDSEKISTRSDLEVKADLLTSGDRKHIEKMRDAMGQAGGIHEMRVPALTWKGLLDKHHLPHPDIVIVDTEGMDDLIVNQIELGANSPSIIQFEHLHIHSSRLEACTKRLHDAGYRFIVSEYDVLSLHQRICQG